MTNILFRSDSSSKIGTGHIMRDLVLASQYKKSGTNIIFATQNLDGNINYKISEAGYKIKILKSNSKKELVRLIKKLKINLLVIDHYKIDYKKEKYIKNKTKVEILSFDDTYEKHHCDILLNHNISANKKRYKDLVPQTCELRCGRKFTLLRDEFYKEKLKKKHKLKKKKHKIFISMGGIDSANINIKILKVLISFNNIEVNIVTTSANKNLLKLKCFSQNKKWINLHIDSKKIAKLMSISNFAIATPSVVANELLFMNINFLAIQVVSTNQNEMFKYLKKHNYLTMKNFKRNKLLQILKKEL